MENGLNPLFTQPKVTTKTSLWQLVDDKSIWKLSTDSWQVDCQNFNKSANDQLQQASLGAT